MNLLNQKLIMVIAGYAICFLILVSIPLRLKYILNRAGKQLVSVRGKNIIAQYLVILFSFVLLTILLFRELGWITDVVICLVSILGTAMGSEEISLNNKCGLYEKGLIGNGHFLPLTEIYALPVLGYTKEEQEHFDSRVLIVTTNRKGALNYIFATAEEKKSVEKGLLKLNPALAR